MPSSKSNFSEKLSGYFSAILALAAVAILIGNAYEKYRIHGPSGIFVRFLGVETSPAFDFVEVSQDSLDDGSTNRIYVAKNWVAKYDSSVFCRARIERFSESGKQTDELYGDLQFKGEDGRVMCRVRETGPDDYGVFRADTTVRKEFVGREDWSQWFQAPPSLEEAFYSRIDEWAD